MNINIFKIHCDMNALEMIKIKQLGNLYSVYMYIDRYLVSTCSTSSLMSKILTAN